MDILKLKKFWKWMEKKKYYLPNPADIKTINNSEFNSSIRPTKYMLLGYMLEYVVEESDFSYLPFDEIYKGLMRDMENIE